MEKILKMMGVNPDEIQTQIKAFADQANKVIKHFDDKITLVIENQKNIESKLDLLLNQDATANLTLKGENDVQENQ